MREEEKKEGQPDRTKKNENENGEQDL